jgi:GNAT superfamily N-acetyltransferase
MRNRILNLLRRVREARYAAGGIRGLVVAPVWLIRRHYLVLEMNITANSGGDTAPSLEWEQLVESTLGELLDSFPEIDHEQTRDRFRKGQICYVCRADGRIIHYRWYVSEPAWLPFLKVTWDPEAGDYTVLGAFTHPDYRRRGVNSALLQQGLARARELGLRRVVSFIADWNGPSLRATRRAGLEQTGTVTLWTLGLKTWHSYSGNARVTKGRLTIERR